METGLWLAANIKGLPEERIQYPSILNLLEIKEKSTGSLSIKPRHLKTAIRAKSRAVRKGRWQLVYFPLNDGHTYKLYDMYADPAMQVDVTEKYSEIAVQLRHLLDDWMIKSEL